jgi:hypothetical protein
MEINNKKCSLEQHADKAAIIYCKNCSIYMCKKCESHHSELFKYHNIISLDKMDNELFDNNCKEKNHSFPLKYFCKTHKAVCCALCISKIKTEYDGKHADCDIDSIDKTKENLQNEFKDKINNLEKNYKTLSDILIGMENLLDNFKDQKEKIKLKIMNIFTEFRNALNSREDELLEEIDKRFNEIYYTENLIKENRVIEKQTKIYLDKNKILNINNIDIIQFINEIDILTKNQESIENKINKLSTLFDKVKNYEIEMEFRPCSGGVGNLLKKIRNFGDIFINENHGLKLYKCFNTIKEENNVLLISNQKFKIINNLLKLNENIKDISIFPPEVIIPKILYKDIYKYKIITYDLQDSGYNIKSNSNYEEIKKYLENGGNIILTHDQIGDYMQLLNVKWTKRDCNRVKKAKIINSTHPIFKSHYYLKLKNNDLIDIDTTHSEPIGFINKKEYNKEILIELEDGFKGVYLLIKEIGKGKLIYWNAGHLYKEGENPHMPDIEQKLFMNLIYWICD